jgi:hypothetical protein
VAETLVIGSATALPLGVPLMFILALAVNGFKTQNPMLYLYSMLIFIVYFIALITVMLILSRRSKRFLANK